MIDAVVEFIEKFFDKEYQALISTYIDRDDKVFEAKVLEVETFYTPGISTGLHRPNPVDEEWLEIGKEAVKSVAPRILFQIKEYNHPDLGKIYRCYVDHYLKSKNNTTPRYTHNLYVGCQKKRLKIISKYHTDWDKDVLTTGLDGGMGLSLRPWGIYYR